MPKPDNKTPHPAADYDKQVRATIPYYGLFHEEVLSLIKALGKTPKRWLDAGCGTGTLVQEALKRFPDAEFVAADPSPQMLAEAKKKLSGKNVAFIEAETQQLPSSLAGSFDVITAIQSHHYLSKSDREEATCVCYSLLSKGGVYVTFENVRPFTREGIEAGKTSWSSFQLMAGRSQEEVDKHMSRFDSEYFPITVEEHLSLLRGCGYSVVELLWYSRMQAGFYAIK